jgi:hypothetical protein
MANKPELPATQRIGILVFDGFEAIDVFGFAEAFAIARFRGQDYAAPPPYPFETVLIARQVAKMKSINGLARRRPGSGALGIVLAGSSWHAHSYGAPRLQVCRTSPTLAGLLRKTCLRKTIDPMGSSDVHRRTEFGLRLVLAGRKG